LGPRAMLKGGRRVGWQQLWARREGPWKVWDEPVIGVMCMSRLPLAWKRLRDGRGATR
jgi:hypothetical protein